MTEALQTVLTPKVLATIVGALVMLLIGILIDQTIGNASDIADLRVKNEAMRRRLAESDTQIYARLGAIEERTKQSEELIKTHLQLHAEGRR